MKMHELQKLPPKVLIYSPAGRGKTALMLTLVARCQVLDLDGNLDVGLGLQDNLRDERLAVDIKQFPEDQYPKKAVAFARFKKYVYGLTEDCAKSKYPFDVVGLDSLTALSQASQNYVMGNGGRLGENPQIQEWGLLLTEIENMIVALRSLPIPVVYLAHEMILTDPDDKTVTYIAIPGQKLPGRVTRMFSEIYYMRVRSRGGGKHQIYLQTHPSAAVSSRSGRGLPDEYHIATFDKNGPVGDSVSMWEIFKQIGYEPPPKEEPKLI